MKIQEKALHEGCIRRKNQRRKNAWLPATSRGEFSALPSERSRCLDWRTLERQSLKRHCPLETKQTDTTTLDSLLMKPPIIIHEPNNLDVFRDVSTAIRYLEPPDVKRGVGVAFDSEGKKLTVRLLPSEDQTRFNRKLMPRIVIEESNEAPAQEELKAILLAYMSNPKLRADLRTDVETLKGLPLSDLVALALLRFESH
jgi:hypothetical protein